MRLGYSSFWTFAIAKENAGNTSAEITLRGGADAGKFTLQWARAVGTGALPEDFEENHVKPPIPIDSNNMSPTKMAI